MVEGTPGDIPPKEPKPAAAEPTAEGAMPEQPTEEAFLASTVESWRVIKGEKPADDNATPEEDLNRAA